MSPWLAVLGVAGGFALASVALSRLAAAQILHPEVARKGLHVAMGLAALTFPWLFPDWRWFALAFGAVVAGLFLMRFTPRLLAGAGGALHGVKRAGSSFGEFGFAAAVAGLYFFAREEPALYVAPLLVLTLADATAALSGVFYGKARYDAPHGGEKSWEGSVVFFFVSFLAVHIPLLLMTDMSDAGTLSVALVLALLATATEGASWDGLDNLFLPLVLALHLQGFLDVGRLPGEPFIGFYAATILTALIGLAWLLGRTESLRTDALMAMVVFGYTFYVGGGGPLVAASLALVAGWLVCVHARPALGRSPPDAIAVAVVAAPAAFAVFLASQAMAIDVFLTGGLAFSTSLGLLLGSTFAADRERSGLAFIHGAAWGVGGAGVIALAIGLSMIMQGMPAEFRVAPALLAAGALGGAIGADRGAKRARIERFASHLVLGAAAVAIGVLLSHLPTATPG